MLLLNLSCSQEAEHIDVVPHAVVGLARDFGGEVIAEGVVGLDKCRVFGIVDHSEDQWVN